MEITAQGSRITVKLNGQTITDGDLKEHTDAEATHPGIKRPGGYIGLQSHSEPVEYRNLAIKPL
jgi:hypothetical protein